MRLSIRVPAIAVAALFVFWMIIVFARWFGSDMAGNVRAKQTEMCAKAVTLGLEAETKWDNDFGCLAKRGDRWVVR